MQHLRTLVGLRNAIAHANYSKVLEILSEGAPLVRARTLYDAVIDAIMLINAGTGYDARPMSELELYFAPLKASRRLNSGTAERRDAVDRT